MLPINHGGHAAYQKFLAEQLRIYYPDPYSIDKDTWNIIERFYYKDLASVDILMQDCYSTLGPEPRLPSHMLRCILVATCFKIHSFTAWARQLKINPLYAILSGFHFGDTPGIGTFYDFNDRLWLFQDKNFSLNIQPPKKSATKPDNSNDKADAITKTTVDDLLKKFQLEPFNEKQPFSRLFEIFKSEFIDTSVRQGLINLHQIDFAGDGSPVVTSAQQRKRRICTCKDNNINTCTCQRHYSQPDCDIGWDSHRKCYYHGYDLYLLTASNSHNDLPIFPLLGPASRHDSHGFIYSFFNMKHLLPDVVVNKLLLDSAHDALPLYQYCQTASITPFIDLNQKRGISLQLQDDFTIGKDGVPVCKIGLKMRRDGVDRHHQRLKFRCPLSSRKDGNCSCENPCSNAKFGRTVHLPLKDNPRVFNIPPRESKQWILEYNARTSAERANKRIKIDYQLENGKYRSSREWYCRLFAILMCLHLDAWTLPLGSSLKSSLLQVA
jgi:hypothetical protein